MREFLQNLQLDLSNLSLSQWASFIPLLALLIVVLTLALGDSVLPSGYWLNGLISGICSAVGMAVLIRICGIEGLYIGLTTGFIAAITVIVASQFVYFDRSVRLLQSEIQSRESEQEWPESWSGLTPRHAYQAQMRVVLSDTEAEGWLDHLRTQSRLGLVARERAPRNHILRSGSSAWFGWLISILLTFAGCVVGGLATTNHTLNYVKAKSPASVQIRDQNHDIGIPASQESDQVVIAGWTTIDGLHNIIVAHNPAGHSVVLTQDEVRSGQSAHSGSGGAYPIESIAAIGLNKWLDDLGPPESQRLKIIEWWTRIQSAG